MHIEPRQAGGKKLHKLVCDFVPVGECMTTTDIRLGLKRSKSHIVRVMHHLTEHGYFKMIAESMFQPITWERTDKIFFYQPKQPKVKKTAKVEPKPCKKPTKKMPITIKPDLAAMWLVSSKPQWETRYIPIVRSTELGVRRGTF